MKTLNFTKDVNLNLLAEELYAAFPEWTKTVTDMQGISYVLTQATVLDGTVQFPDETDEAAVQAVIGAHDPAGQSHYDKEKAQEKDADDQFTGMPAWLKDATYESVEQAIQDRTVGNVSKADALAAVDAAANLADVKAILKKLVSVVYGLVDVNQKLARVLLALVFFVKRRR